MVLAEPLAPSASDEAPRSLLAAWANAQDHWVRALVSEAVQTKRELSEPRIDYYYHLFKREKGLDSGDTFQVPPLSTGDAGGAEAEILQLLKLTELKHVNLLNDGEEIEFNPHLTLLYGENAAGKSGYVRVLKQVASVRTAEPILPNVADPGEHGQVPEATISYRTGETEGTIH